MIIETILIVDDEEEIVAFIRDRLELEGYQVETAITASEMLTKVEQEIHLIILDIMLPDMNGFELCQEVRERVNCPILFLSAIRSEEAKIEGLMLGGDDYMTKPFSMNELLARVEAHLRREARRVERKKVHPILRFGSLKIDLHGANVRYLQQTIPLTQKEFQLVTLLALHPGRVFSKEHMLEKIWGFDTESDQSTVVEHIKKIRAKLTQYDPQHAYIQTVWGIGYKWEISQC